MPVTWTPEQQDAIDARNTSVIVSAAAGSGKTAVLVERLLRILSDTENKVPADRLIVVTFTNDAAAQMKQRLSEAISAKLESDPDNSWLSHQQSLIPAAKISTIHSFCFDMIRENVQTLGVSAGFRILDDTEEQLVTAKALDNVFERFYSEKPELTDFLANAANGVSRSDDRLEKNILSLYDFLKSMPFPQKWMDKARDMYAGEFDADNVLGKIYADMVSGKLSTISARMKYASELAGKAGDEARMALFCDEHALISGIEKTVHDTHKPWNERFNIQNIAWENLTRYRTKTKKDTPERVLAETAAGIRAKCKDDMAKLASAAAFTEEEIKSDFDKNRRLISGMAEILAALEEETAALKAEKNALSFSDAEHFAVKLLCDEKDGCIVPSPLAKELSDFYKVIMIDEFQDANDTQNLIFRMLSHNGSADKNGDDLFTVGDVKQSIYRFRQANPNIFISCLKAADEYTKDYTGKNAAVFLNKNFRSSSDVVDFVNVVFGYLMSEQVGGIDYTDKERLALGAKYPDADRSTEFIIAAEVQSDNADDDSDVDGEESVADINAEAYAAAKKIRSMLGSATVTEKDVTRPCRCSDFCILLRDRKRSQLYIDALAQFGIKSTGEETMAYLDSREISVLVNLLRVVDNPMLDIPLVSVLMSPMFLLTDEETAQLRLLSKEKGSHIYNAVLAAQNDDTIYPAKEKLARFCEVYGKLRICAASQSLERLIRTIYDSTGFLASVQVYADGEQKKANLRLLLEYAKSYEQNSDGGLSGFIRYLDDISARGKDFVRASVNSAADDVVSIKTIHKSKGLEYPFVFLCGTSKQFNMSDTRDPMQIHNDLGLGFKIHDRDTMTEYTSFPQYVISQVNARETKSEEMRLLYVALTRAKEQLFITLPESTLDKALSKAATALNNSGIDPSDASNMQEWLLSVLLTHDKGRMLLPDMDLPQLDCPCRIKITRSSEISAEPLSAAEENTPQPDDDTVNKMLARLNYRYDTDLSQKAAKLTITEIAKSEQGDIFLRRPDFSGDYRRLTAAEVGTATHTFMQYADFAAAEADVHAQADKLTDMGILSEAEAKALNYGSLESFFRSPLYARMKKSGEIRREQKFLIEISELSLDDELGKEYNNTNGMLQGIADCMFAEGDGFILLDYKTDRVTGEKVLIDRYYRQLYLYSIALEKIFGRKISEGYIYSFCLNKEIRLF